MNKTGNLFARHWRNLHFLVIIILIIVLITADSSIVPKVNEVTLTVFYSPFDKIKQTFLNLQTLAEENDLLKAKLNEISLKISYYEETARENDRLRSILGFEPPTGYTLLPAKVIATSGEFIPTSAIINKGANDSVYIDQPVINQFGLIGRISSVSNNHAVVQLLTDPSHRVAARLMPNREMGIIRYSFADGLLLDNFPVQGTAQIHDTIISSGLGGVYPAGLKIGAITEIYRGELETFCRINVEPFANFYSIEEMFIVKEISQ